MVPPRIVAPAGVEPARLLGRGILNADRRRTSVHERVISAGCDTPGGVAEHGCTPDEAEGVQQTPGRDVVEVALAEALIAASRAGEWQVVAQLATELQARREARLQLMRSRS